MFHLVRGRARSGNMGLSPNLLDDEQATFSASIESSIMKGLLLHQLPVSRAGDGPGNTLAKERNLQA